MTAIEQRNLMQMPVQERREKILKEVELKMRSEDKYGFLNNFFSNLPDESIQPGGGERRNICINAGIMDMNYGDFLNEDGETKKKYASDLKLSQTPRGFYAAIDKALVDTHVPMPRLLELQSTLHRMMMAGPRYTADQIKEMNILLSQICEMTLPAYIELRVIGYTHNDLAS